MKLKPLGRTGLFVSELCLGTMTFGGGDEGIWGKIGRLQQDEAERIVGGALDAGINFIDTADVYAGGRSEEITGQALQNLKVPRENVVVATKVFGETGAGANARGATRSHISPALKDSLRRLQLDHVDLYQIHGFDPATPIEETVRALDTMVAARPRPLRRRLELGGLADHEGDRHLGAARPGALREPAGLLHGRRPRPRARAGADAAEPKASA